MTYLGIDRRRFEYVLSLGADEFELRRFFTECRTALIQHGGKVQNIPQGQKARIRSLAFELPATTDGDVQTWFGKHLTMVDPEEPAKVVEEFRLYEELREQLPEDEARRLARSCLVHLFSERPPSVLTEFLCTPIGGQRTVKDVAEEPVQVPAVTSALQTMSNASVALSKLLVNLLEGQDVDEDLAELSPELGTFISGLQAGQLGRSEDARAIAAALPEGSALRLSLDAFVKRLDARRNASGAPVRGLWTQDESSFSGEFFVERDEVLGYCTNAGRSNAVFVKPLAIVRAGQVMFLSDDDAQRIFPDTGDLMSFPGPGRPRQPTRGEIGVWQVAEHDTEKRTRFHLASDKRLVFEARMVPFPSTDHDSVREYLKEAASRAGRQLLHPYVYQLSDGLVVAARLDRADLTRDETFEQGLLAWNSLPALRLEGRLFVVGPLPKEQSLYECGSLASAAKSVFGSKGSSGAAGGLTKTQLRDLAQSLGDAESALIGQRVERLSVELVRLADQREALDVLVDQVAQRSEVKSRIDQVVASEVAKKVAMRTDLQADIDRLKRDRAEGEERTRKQREEHKKLRDETAKVVRSAFDRALNEGIPKLLAEVAIFHALVPATTTIEEAASATGARRGSHLVARDLVVSGEDPISALRKFGVTKQQASAFVAAAKAVQSAGLMLTVKGAVARPAVEAWASALGKRGVVIDVPVGLVDDADVRELLAGTSAPEVLVALDANLSALDIYARPLTDIAIGAIAGTSEHSSPATFLVLSEGLGALPVPRTFERLCVLLDFDRRYEFRATLPGGDIHIDARPIEELESLTQLWELGARRLAVEVDKLPVEDQGLVLAILAG